VKESTSGEVQTDRQWEVERQWLFRCCEEKLSEIYLYPLMQLAVAVW